MNASELIEKLQRLVDEYGDQPVKTKGYDAEVIGVDKQDWGGVGRWFELDFKKGG